MLYEILEVLGKQVENYLDKEVTLGNVANIDEPNANRLDDTIILSLINMSEENTMKNWVNQRKVGTSTLIKQPVINLNLYVMFCVNRSENQYNRALADLSKIVEFFQGKKVFTQANSIYNHSADNPSNNVNSLSNLDNFRFHIELYTPTFEEQSYIWGSLGGKQRPSAIYKISVIRIEGDEVQTQAGQIQETNQSINQM